MSMAQCRVLTSVRPLVRPSHMPRARMVFAGRVQIKAACSKALCCALGVPIPSHDRCAIPLLALFCPDVLATAPAYAVTAGAW